MNYAAIAVPEVGARGEQAAPSSKPAPRSKPPAAQTPSPDAPMPSPSDESVKRLLEQPPEKEKGEKMHGELSGEGEIYRRKLILKLKSYATSFPDVCGELLKDKGLENMDTRQLEVLLNEVKFTVGARTSQIVTGAFSSQILLLEQYLLAENTSLYVEGPSVQLTQLANSKDYQDLVKELTLEYADWIYQRPENRFFAFMANAVMTMHSVNSKAIENGAADPKKRKRAFIDPNTANMDRPLEDKEEPPKKMARVEQVPETVQITEVSVEQPARVESPKPAAGRDEFGYEVAKTAVQAKPKPKPAPNPAIGRGAK